MKPSSFVALICSLAINGVNAFHQPAVAEQVATIAQNITLTSTEYIAAAKQKYGKGDYEGSLANYDRAIQIDPNRAIIYYNRGSLKHIDFQDTQGALADYNRAIQLAPKFAEVYYNRGSLKAEKLQDIQGALADYNRAIQLSPRLANAYFNRGLIKYDLLENRSGGITDLQQAAQLFKQQGNTNNYQLTIDRLKKWQ
jgi:tetratricopeptide (TPR) repeat protein